MKPLADWFAEVVRENAAALKADLIVPVPPHKSGGASAASTRRKCRQNGLRSGWDCRVRALLVKKTASAG